MPQDALAEVGLKNPGGDAPTLHRNAQGWADLSAYLSDHSVRVAALASFGLEKWQGESADAFAARAKLLAQNAAATSQTTAAVAAQQQQHANTHQMVVQIIIELAVQIAAMLAFYAAAAAFPALLAWAQAWLTYLITTGARVLRMLAEALNALVRFLVRARTWITKVMDLTWKGERFSVGYGRMMVEGVRDVAIDLSANLVSSGIQGKKIDPAQLFISAGISGGIGGFIGGLEKSGMKKVLDEAGNVKLGADGLPKFATFDKQVKDFVKSVGPPPKPKPPAPPVSDATRLLNDAKGAYGNAKNLGVKGTPGERLPLADNLGGARNAHGDAVARNTRATEDLRRAGDDVTTGEHTVRAYQNAVDQARNRVSAADTSLDAYRAAGNPKWVDDGVRELADARRELTAASDGLGNAQNALGTSRQDLLNAQRNAALAGDDVTAAGTRLDLARDRANAWLQLDAARGAARDQTTIGQQLAFMRQQNEWSASFGAPKGWQETLLYDVPKDAVKGMANGAAKSAAEVARGNGQSGDIWKDALLGGATGAVRGGVNSVAGNTAFPTSGIEETLWKIGSKTMDDYTRRKIEAATYGKPV
jgi:hypothetical protein